MRCRKKLRQATGCSSGVQGQRSQLIRASSDQGEALIFGLFHWMVLVGYLNLINTSSGAAAESRFLR